MKIFLSLIFFFAILSIAKTGQAQHVSMTSSSGVITQVASVKVPLADMPKATSVSNPALKKGEVIVAITSSDPSIQPRKEYIVNSNDVVKPNFGDKPSSNLKPTLTVTTSSGLEQKVGEVK